MPADFLPPDLPPGSASAGAGSNAPPFLSITELSQLLKRTVESNFDFVRVRAEISRPTRAASGHLYFTLKDEKNTLDAVCWKTVAGFLGVQPEEGLEVVVTGKLTIYGGRSKYQIVVQTMEMAGEGAMLRQLEERRRRLAAEGLFDAGRKQPLPVMPAVIGVVTSPTGAVIRDILHRLSDRFGVRVLLWGTLVQGQEAAGQVARAIRGFDAMPEDGPLPRPDLLIVARGGGSLEDLWAFNEEEVVRVVAGCSLPVISAIGHETDTTLIDFTADMRAPTPTAAAEMAVPVRAELVARLGETETRLYRGVSRRIEMAGQSVRLAARGLLDPAQMVERRAQAFDLTAAAIDSGIDGRMGQLIVHKISLPAAALEQAGRLLDANSFERVLDRGFALVAGADGKPLKRSAEAATGADVSIRFADATRAARLDPDGPAPASPPKPKRAARAKPSADGQDSLF